MSKDQSVGSRVSPDLIQQIVQREKILGKSREGDARKSLLLNANTAWVKLRSSVNRIDEDKLKQSGKTLDDLLVDRELSFDISTTTLEAESFILIGGTKATQEGSKLGKERTGISRNGSVNDSSKAYNNFSGEYGLGYRPMPGITDVTIASKNTYGTLMEATVKFKVFSVEDLEICELLYFRPGYTALLEWGHSVYVDNESSIKQTGIDTGTISDEFFFSAKDSMQIDDAIESYRSKANGNYDGMYAYITNFSFDFESDGSYNCTVKLVSRGVILEGLKPTKTSDKTDEEDEKTDPVSRMARSIYHYIFGNLTVGKKYGKFDGKKYLETRRLTKIANFLESFQVFSMETDIEGHFLGDKLDSTFPLHFITLRDFLMIVNRMNSLTDPRKLPTKRKTDEIFDLSYGNKFVTFPDHISADPIVAFPPKAPTGESKSLNGKSGRLGWFTKAKSAGEIYKACTIDKLGKDIEEYVKSTEGGTNDVLNIMVSTYAIEKSINDTLEGAQDENASVYQIVKDVLNNVQAALAEVNTLDLHYNHTTNRYQVVDRNHTVPGGLPVINMTGLETTVSNLSINSTISRAASTQVAIAAQGNQGNYKENVAAILEWNRGAIDRHIPIRTTDENVKDEDSIKAKEKYLAKLYNFYYKWNDRGGVFSIQNYVAEDMESLRSEINADMQTLRNFYSVKNSTPVQGVVPVELSFDLMGIHGFIIGTTFKINKGLLPSKYDNWAYIVTGIENKISNNKWITSIKTQFFPDRNITAEARKNLKQQSTSTSPSIQRDGALVGDQEVATGACGPVVKLEKNQIPNALNPTGEIRVNATSYAYKKTFENPTTGVKSMCARYSYSFGYHYSKYVKSNGSYRATQDLYPAGGNANQPGYHNNLVGLGYSKISIGQNITKAELINYLSSGIQYNYGDIVAYWANDGGGSHKQYGHTQFYVGNINNVKWSSSVPTNYGGNFPYSRRDSKCWNLLLFRAPLT